MVAMTILADLQAYVIALAERLLRQGELHTGEIHAVLNSAPADYALLLDEALGTGRMP
jgi:hypothetical protein